MASKRVLVCQFISAGRVNSDGGGGGGGAQLQIGKVALRRSVDYNPRVLIEVWALNTTPSRLVARLNKQLSSLAAHIRAKVTDTPQSGH